MISNRKSRFKKTVEEKIEDGAVNIPDHLLKKYQQKNYQTIQKIEQVGIPQKNEQVRIITMKSFNTVAFIELIAKKEIIEHLVLVIFAINVEAAQSIINLKRKGQIKKVTLIVSSIRNAGHKIRSKAVQLFRNNNYKITFVNSHAKISAIKTKSNHYVIEGSGNMSYNGRIEQYIIDNDENLFNFTLNWIQDMKESMKQNADYSEI